MYIFVGTCEAFLISIRNVCFCGYLKGSSNKYMYPQCLLLWRNKKKMPGPSLYSTMVMNGSFWPLFSDGDQFMYNSLGMQLNTTLGS